MPLGHRVWDLRDTSPGTGLPVTGGTSWWHDSVGLHLATERRRLWHRVGPEHLATGWLPQDLADAWTIITDARLVEGALTVGIHLQRDGDAADLLVAFAALRQRLAVALLHDRHLRVVSEVPAACDAFLDVRLRVSYHDHAVRAMVTNADTSRVCSLPTADVPRRAGLAVLGGHGAFREAEYVDTGLAT